MAVQTSPRSQVSSTLGCTSHAHTQLHPQIQLHPQLLQALDACILLLARSVTVGHH